MAGVRTLVLNKTEVALKIQRIAWEIFEKHVNEETIYLVGISKSGFWLAKQMLNVLGDISDLNLKLVEMEVNKKDPISGGIRMSIDVEELNNKCVGYFKEF